MCSRRIRSSKTHVVAPVRLLTAALGVVLVDAPDGLVREAQPELVDDQAEVAEVQRAGEELEPVVPRLALDERQRVAVERVHAVADRRTQRHQAAQRDPVARAVAAHDHVLRPRADVAPHELLRVLKATAAEDDGAARGARPRSGPRPRDGPPVAVRLDRLDAGIHEHLGALTRARRGTGPPTARARRGRRGHEPPAPIRSFRHATGGVERQPVRLEPRPRVLELVDKDPLQVGVAARDPVPRELIGRRRTRSGRR